MRIGKDRTYKKKVFVVEGTENAPDFNYAPELKEYATKLLEQNEFLEGLECIDLKGVKNKNGKYNILFTFWIDEIDILREELPHLFV